MRILADQNIPLVDEFFGELGEIRRLPGREIDAQAVAGCDILLVRSITRVDAALLAGSPVRFVGTCTIGTDHIDLDYLHERRIGFASAPGCNADSVVDYVLSSLSMLAEEQDCRLDRCTIGIVGAGNVAGRPLPGLRSAPCARRESRRFRRSRCDSRRGRHHLPAHAPGDYRRSSDTPPARRSAHRRTATRHGAAQCRTWRLSRWSRAA